MLHFNTVEKEKNMLLHYLKFSLWYLKKKNMSGIVEIKKINNFNLMMRNKILENLEYSSNIFIYITVYHKNRKYSISLSNVTKYTIQQSIDRAFLIIKHIEKDNDNDLPNKNLLFQGNEILNLFFPWNFNIKKVKNLVLDVENSALNYNKFLIQSEGSLFNSSIIIKILGNSYDWFKSQLFTENYLSSCMIASNTKNMERHCEDFLSRDFKDLQNPTLLGLKSAHNSILKLGSQRIKTQITPIIFSCEVSYNLFSYLAKALSGYAVYKKNTFLYSLLNTQIFPNWLEILEDPFYLKGLFSTLFDQEGVKTKRRKIVKKGKIKTWLLDTYYGKKIFKNSTGHSGGIHNWFVNSRIPRLSFENLLKKMFQGILITEVMGEGVNMMTGNYSQGASGFWIEKGCIKYPIHGITISGNLLNLWKNIINLSNDSKKYQKISCASILLSKIQVSGI
ncbi:metallopeptidase TldD-related protein [Buchnera aphidicola]|uniref:metallopeptidase TldD-related protein n=1 Tax=Buchnera aphidicola TaxID=9 RepID=UPI0031B877BA